MPNLTLVSYEVRFHWASGWQQVQGHIVEAEDDIEAVKKAYVSGYATPVMRVDTIVGAVVRPVVEASGTTCQQHSATRLGKAGAMYENAKKYIRYTKNDLRDICGIDLD